jgi:hypothetical protein
MLHSKLIDIFTVLDTKELKLLRKFVNSPVYNQHKDVIRLFDYIVSLDKFTEEKLKKELVYRVVFNKGKYDDLRLRHVVSYLLRICEACLEYIESQKNTQLFRLNLLKAYRKRSLTKHFLNDMLLQKKISRDASKKGASSFLLSSQINEEAYSVSLSNASPEQHYLLNAENAVTNYYLLTQLKLACKLLAFEPHASTENFILLAAIVAYLRETNLSQQPEIDTYYTAFLAFEHPEDTGLYARFKEKISVHALRFEEQELYELFSLAIQYCKNKIQAGALEFERELFDVYLYGLSSEAMLHNQTLSFEMQKSIVDIGLRLREFSWVSDFVSDSKHLTDKTYREELFRLNTAKIHFAKSNFKSCLSLLNEQKIKNPLLQIEAQMLLIKTLKELNELTQLRLEQKKLKALQLKGA